MGGLIGLALSGVAWYGIKLIVAPAVIAETPLDIGKKWFVWVSLVVCLTTLSKFLSGFDTEHFARWVLAMFTFSLPAFLLGFAYGKFFKFKAQPTNT